MSFLWNLPVVRPSSCFLGLPSVNYVAFNKMATFEACKVNGAEIPLKHLKLCYDKRPTLFDFLRNREVPVSWGDHTDDQILNRSPRTFEGLMFGLSEIEEVEYGRYNEPYLKKAVSWPLSYPSHTFFNLAVRKTEMGNWLHSSMWATMMLRMSHTDNLEESIIKVRKRIIEKANDMGLDLSLFTGENLILEIAHLQCLRLIYASRKERERGVNHSKTYSIVRSYDCFSVISDVNFDPMIADSLFGSNDGTMSGESDVDQLRVDLERYLSL
ncbi:nonstructural protein [Munguba virus]|uniref:Nonstructural protein n=1 Tax=Munguba virus TaxID=1048854 RepID=I1T343_9VIRU|nr:nonstructural protein [Munguba virus]AEL29660.1 nonstructural protein [Munguba virus]API68890.1 nonstructural protein [Munguba virus]